MDDFRKSWFYSLLFLRHWTSYSLPTAKIGLWMMQWHWCFSPHWNTWTKARPVYTLSGYSLVFDTMRTMKLTVKLANLGVPTPTCNWILDFLIDRPQVVRMGSKTSAELKVSTGTPQVVRPPSWLEHLR